MRLNVLEDEGRFIVDAARVDAPLVLPPFFFGEVKPIELCVFRKGQNGLYAVDVSSYEINLQLGPANVRPSQGFWQLTTTEGTSPAINARASANDVADALRDAFGVVLVEGGNGSYIVTLIATGVWATPTATFLGETLSNVLVFEISPGTADVGDVPGTPAQYRIEVLEVAPARIVPAHWTEGDTTQASTFTQVSGLLWQLVIDPQVSAGFFTLTIDGVETGFVSFFAGAYEIQTALNAAGKTATVQLDGTGGFYVLFASAVATASVGGNLVILPFQTGSLALTSTGIRELLDGLQFAPCKLSLILVKDGQTVMAANADVMLCMPINQPSVITIDAPQMAGITFAISNDDTYLQVYVNGVHAYDIPLNNPSGAGNLNVYENGFLSFSIPLNNP